MNSPAIRRIRRPGERGVIAVLSAFVLPLMAYFMFGMVEFGMMAVHQVEVQNAADAVAMTNSYPTIVAPVPERGLPTIGEGQFSGPNFESPTAAPSVTSNFWSREWDGPFWDGPPGPMAQAVIPTPTASYFSFASVSMPHYSVLGANSHSLLGIAQIPAVAKGSVLVSQFVWNRLSPVPSRVIWVLDFSTSMTLTMHDSIVPALEQVKSVASTIIQDHIGSAQDGVQPGESIINWGFLPFSAFADGTFTTYFEGPAECQISVAPTTALDLQYMGTHAQTVYDAINRIPSKPLGSNTDIGSAIDYLNKKIERHPDDPGCSDITYLLVSDGAPSAHHTGDGTLTDQFFSNRGASQTQDQEDAKAYAYKKRDEAISAAKGPRIIKTLFLRTAHGSDAEDAAAFDKNTAVMHCLTAHTGAIPEINLPTDHYYDASTFDDLDNIKTSSLFISTLPCLGFNLKVPQGSWMLPLPTVKEYPLIASGAFYVSRLGQGNWDEVSLERRVWQSQNMDTDPATKKTSVDVDSTYYSYFFDSEYMDRKYAYMKVNSSLCRRFLKFPTMTAVKLRYGIPILADDWSGQPQDLAN
jgi:hypothetical protein